MLHYMIGGTLLTMISGNLLNSLVTATLDTLYSSASFVRHGSDSNKTIQKIRFQIEELDIKIKLELVQKLLVTLPDGEYKNIVETGLIEIIYKIKTLIEWIDYEINKHQLKWFAGYRNLSVDDKLENLKHYTKILDGRITILLGLSSNKTSISNISK